MSRICLMIVVLWLAGGLASGEGIVIDSPMNADPALVIPPTGKSLLPGHKELWIEVLDNAETELTMRSAEAIARAHREGMEEMSEAAPHLNRVFGREDLPLPVRLAVAQALVTIEARQFAPQLYDGAREGGVELQQIIEPALAIWKHAPARDQWLSRLSDRTTTPHALQLLAVRCLHSYGDPSEPAAELMIELAGDRQAALSLRLEAARAAAEFHKTGLEEFASRFVADHSPAAIVDRLVATTVLQHHRSERTTELLTSLALDDEPTVAAIALRWLLDTDPALVAPLVDRIVLNSDANVRSLAVESLLAVPSIEGIATLGMLLDDPHPDVRSAARDAMFTLADDAKWDQPVREAGMKAHAHESWRALEQSSLLLGALDHEAARDQMIALLRHDRPEVLVASAWGLRKLALPDTLEPALEVARFRKAEIDDFVMSEAVDAQLSQLFQMFGAMDYRPAEELMKEFIPKLPPKGEFARVAAIWSIGHFHAGQPDSDLVAAFSGRLRDVNADPPEMETVRTMSAVSLGRMKAEAALPALREYCEPEGAFSTTGAACQWAITQITWETFPEPAIRRLPQANWFLEPLP